MLERGHGGSGSRNKVAGEKPTQGDCRVLLSSEHSLSGSLNSGVHVLEGLEVGELGGNIGIRHHGKNHDCGGKKARGNVMAVYQQVNYSMKLTITCTVKEKLILLMVWYRP
jgi:hypothetical protein